MIAVSALYIHPIKSCQGIRVESARLDRRGFVDDRRWMIVDASGRFVTQREEPALAKIKVRVNVDDDALVVSTDNARALTMPRTLDTGTRRDVRVWSSTVQAVTHDEGSVWFSDVLKREVFVVTMPSDVERAVNPAHARQGDIVGFADGYPLLIASDESLADLNARIGDDANLSMTRFRPNIVLRGGLPFFEDALTQIQIGSVGVRVVSPCERCVITTLDPLTGEAGREPLATLAKFRRDGNGVTFGMNAIHDAEGTINVGDVVAC